MSIKNNEESLPNLLNQILKEAKTYKSNHTKLIQLSMPTLNLYQYLFLKSINFPLKLIIQIRL